MALEGYKNAANLPVSAADKKTFEDWVATIKSSMLGFGYAREAVEQLSFELTAHTLTISEEEARTGACHTKANGKPFFALTISAPGSLEEMQLDQSLPYKQASVKSQSLMLAFECGVNIANNMEYFLKAVYPEDHFKQGCAGGANMGFDAMKVETTFQVPVEKYMNTFAIAARQRLTVLDKKGQPQAPKPPKGPSF